MVKQNNSVNKSTSKKSIAHPKTTTKKKIQNSPTKAPKKFRCCIMRASNDYGVLMELERKKELENRAKGKITMICSECKTKTTPLWRKGPKGPKTLCNACGLRLVRLEKARAKKESGKNKPLATSSGSSSEEVKKP